MSTDKTAIALYPFRLKHPRTGRWYRAPWLASEQDIKARGGEICGPPEIRGGAGLSAGHVQSSPAPGAPLPPDLSADATTAHGDMEEVVETSLDGPSPYPAAFGTLLQP